VSRRVRLEPEAEAELYAAAARYEREVRGLGKDFVAGDASRSSTPSPLAEQRIVR